MNKFIYEVPFFKAVKTTGEDIMTTSETAFGAANGFDDPSVTPSQTQGDWNMPGVII